MYSKDYNLSRSRWPNANETREKYTVSVRLGGEKVVLAHSGTTDSSGLLLYGSGLLFCRLGAGAWADDVASSSLWLRFCWRAAEAF